MDERLKELAEYSKRKEFHCHLNFSLNSSECPIPYHFTLERSIGMEIVETMDYITVSETDFEYLLGWL